MRSRLVGGATSLTVWSLVALALGLAVGALGHGSKAIGFAIFGEIVDPLGHLWLSSLQMTVLPLVVVHLLAAIVGAGGSDPLGALGTRAIVLFVAMLVGKQPPEVSAIRKPTKEHFYRRFREAWDSVNLAGGDEASIPVVIDERVARDALTMEPAGDGWLATIRRVLRPAKPLIEPVVRRALPAIGRAAGRRTQ